MTKLRLNVLSKYDKMKLFVILNIIHLVLIISKEKLSSCNNTYDGEFYFKCAI